MVMLFDATEVLWIKTLLGRLHIKERPMGCGFWGGKQEILRGICGLDEEEEAEEERGGRAGFIEREVDMMINCWAYMYGWLVEGDVWVGYLFDSGCVWDWSWGEKERERVQEGIQRPWGLIWIGYSFQRGWNNWRYWKYMLVFSFPSGAGVGVFLLDGGITVSHFLFPPF